MKRPVALGVNLLLVLLSAVLAFLLMLGADRALGLVLPEPPFPGVAGLLFPPGEESAYATHDFTCAERINSLGFRDREVSIERGDAFRVIVIGDSFTYGWGVNLEDTWVKRAEHGLREQGLDVELLNLGAPAAGPGDYARAAARAIPRLHPDMVVVAILAGDDLQQAEIVPPLDKLVTDWFPNLPRLVRDWPYLLGRPWPDRIPTRRNEQESRQAWVMTAGQLYEEMRPEERARVDALEPAVREAFFQGGVNPWMIAHAAQSPDYFASLGDGGEAELRRQSARMARSLRRIRRLAQDAGISLLVLSVPEGFLVNDAAYRNVQRVGFRVTPDMLMSENADRAVEAACARAGARFHAVSQGFQERRGDPGLYYELDRHFTPEGNALFAELVVPALAREVGDAMERIP